HPDMAPHGRNDYLRATAARVSAAHLSIHTVVARCGPYDATPGRKQDRPTRTHGGVTCRSTALPSESRRARSRARSLSPPRRRYPTASATSSATARMQWTVRGGSRAGRSACSAARCSRAARSAEVAMRTSRWVLAILVTASTVLAAVSVGVRRGEGGGFPPPSSGSLLPFDSTLLGPPRNLATLIDTGLDVVEDVATIGDTVLMLSRSSWRVVTGTRTRGPFGAEPPGSPQGIGRANR